MKGSMQHLLAYIIGGAFLIAMIYFISDPARTEILSATLNTWGLVLGIDFVISITYFIWPRKAATK